MEPVASDADSAGGCTRHRISVKMGV